MITYSNIVRYDNLPFDDYLNLAGYSHSFLKRERNGIMPHLEITDNILLGALVDSILTEPSRVQMSHVLYPAASKIAATLKHQYGDLIKHFKTQVSYTATVECSGLEMQVKGRTDFLLESRAIIDLKVTKAKNVSALIQYMGYENQVWHYAKLAQVEKAYILIYSVPLKRTFIIPMQVQNSANDFWIDKILLFGSVKNNIAI